MQDENVELQFARLRRLLNKPKYRPREAEARHKRGRPSQLDERRETVLKMLQDGKRATRQDIMSKLRIKRKATFYEIADEPLDPSGEIFLEHDKVHDKWYLSSALRRKRTMSQCRELNLLIDAIKDERLDFYIPRTEPDSLVNRAVHDPEAEKLLAEESPEPRFEGQEEPGMTDEDVMKSFEKKYSDTTSISGVQVRRSILPRLKDDKDRERGAIYWHVQPLDKKPDDRKLSRKEREEIRERDQPRIKMLLEKCGPMSPGSFMYLIPEALLLCRGQLDAGYFSGKRSLAEMSDEELKMVRRTAFGQSKRLSILYTFDVDETFEWFRKHRSEGPVQEELRSRFKEREAGMKVVDELAEKLRRQDEERARKRSDHE